ncbi:hypothetical protein EFL26_20735 [Nocardioides pocheonensis]|uniref:Uncharacterized protein n=1 Tax=Nocardioides pocheonensis TaxID=661485 RepID=A0A3N0GIE0_9ACTN|nr:hypothetical protein EFL26_20735 [Nocardioides pocheonensis]
MLLEERIEIVAATSCCRRACDGQDVGKSTLQYLGLVSGPAIDREHLFDLIILVIKLLANDFLHATTLLANWRNAAGSRALAPCRD